MDVRILFLSSILFVFGEGLSSGAANEAEVRIFLLLDTAAYGTIPGEAPLPNDPNTFAIEVVEVRDKVTSPRDPASGLPTGKRIYEGVVIRKPVDKATPLIATLLANNADVTEAELRIYMEDTANGSLVHRFTYTLETASISGIERQFFGMPVGSTELVVRPEEEVTIHFQWIRILDVVNNIEFVDSIDLPFDVPVPDGQQVSESDSEQEEVAQLRDDATATMTP